MSNTEHEEPMILECDSCGAKFNKDEPGADFGYEFAVCPQCINDLKEQDKTPIPGLELRSLPFYCEDSLTLEELSVRFSLLAKYCSARAQAVRLRREGLYIEAHSNELQALHYYAALPLDWRW